MQTRIEGGKAFGHIHVELEPGESITAESDAMSSMAADLDMTAKLNGGLIKGLLRKFFGGESLFINTFTNNTPQTKHLTLVQGTPGETRELKLSGGDKMYFQPGAYIASTPGVHVGMQWAGFKSAISREGLFKLVASGEGSVWFGSYGALLEKQIDGSFIVDTSHLVAYEPGVKLNLQLSGGIFSSFFSGEGLVSRMDGKGKIIIQTRSMSGLAGWLNPKL